MRDIIMVHEDVLTAHLAVTNLKESYISQGHEVVQLSPIKFRLVFPDGYVYFYWESGIIYQEIVEADTLIA